MYTDTYRIVQVADDIYMVENLRRVYRNSSPFFWKKGYWAEHWERSARGFQPGFIESICQRFPSEADAQKWIDDHRKYPIVIKQPA